MIDGSDKPQKKFTPVQAKLKAEGFCAYQERAQQEVREKLYSWGLYSRDVEQIIGQLIEDNFLNEERFARAYVRGKFNIKGWGRIKIKQGLKLKKISAPLVRIAMTEINASDYFARLESILVKKNALIREENVYKRKNKLAQYALGRGYESNLVWEAIGGILEG
ncbi:regulatory protein RecX [Sphingobacterium corticis]|uniref:Regulatory protein RecX n=1 Tax=Sphingobacterium corticis TaxID=1812823 RepID=A0ABW5NKH4_9SPHI